MLPHINICFSNFFFSLPLSRFPCQFFNKKKFVLGQRKSNAYLDVPSANFNHLQISDNEEDVDRLRTFSSSKGGELYAVLLRYIQNKQPAA